MESLWKPKDQFRLTGTILVWNKRPQVNSLKKGLHSSASADKVLSYFLFCFLFLRKDWQRYRKSPHSYTAGVMYGLSEDQFDSVRVFFDSVIPLREIYHRRYSEIFSKSFQFKKIVMAKAWVFLVVTKALDISEVVKYIKV